MCGSGEMWRKEGNMGFRKITTRCLQQKHRHGLSIVRAETGNGRIVSPRGVMGGKETHPQNGCKKISQVAHFEAKKKLFLPLSIVFLLIENWRERRDSWWGLKH